MSYTIGGIVKRNRETLAGVDHFVDDADYNGSPDGYGLPRHVKHLLDLPIDDQITYVDLLMFLQHFISDRLRYVEIGVSVLKTFFQVSSFLDYSDLYAFDINPINPTIAKRFVKLRNDSAQAQCYAHGSNRLGYFQGDVFKASDFANFQRLVGGKVQIIFSDAHHTGKGIQSEYETYIKNALADDFILYYDDLETPSMYGYFMQLRELYRKRKGVTVALLKVNGWLGQHEHPHLNGIITSLDLRTLLASILKPVTALGRSVSMEQASTIQYL